MAYQIGSACVSCGACADVCPVGAISQGDDRYVIDANACLDCAYLEQTAYHGLLTLVALGVETHRRTDTEPA